MVFTIGNRIYTEISKADVSITINHEDKVAPIYFNNKG